MARIKNPFNKEASKIAWDEWKRIIKIFTDEGKEFTEKDVKTLELYCSNYEKFKKCEEVLLKNGYTFETENGYVQQRPEVSISNKAQEKMLGCAKELGLTPAARARMKKNDTNFKNNDDYSEEDKQMEELFRL